jgi:hypothetical protein
MPSVKINDTHPSNPSPIRQTLHPQWILFYFLFCTILVVFYLFINIIIIKGEGFEGLKGCFSYSVNKK